MHSKGFLGINHATNMEYFRADGQVWRAPVSNPLQPNGYRLTGSDAWVCSASQWVWREVREACLGVKP